jgi:hypothetical protein
MPAYPIGIGKEDYKVLEKEAQRKRCSTRDLIKEAFNRNIDSLRGGIGRRRRR